MIRQSAPPVVVGTVVVVVEAVVVGVVGSVVSSVGSSVGSLVPSALVSMAVETIKHKITRNNFSITTFSSPLESLQFAYRFAYESIPTGMSFI